MKTDVFLRKPLVPVFCPSIGFVGTAFTFKPWIEVDFRTHNKIGTAISLALMSSLSSLKAITQQYCFDSDLMHRPIHLYLAVLVEASHLAMSLQHHYTAFTILKCEHVIAELPDYDNGQLDSMGIMCNIGLTSVAVVAIVRRLRLQRRPAPQNLGLRPKCKDLA